MSKFEEIKCKIRDIKSPFNLKKIFSFLEPKQKLNMIIYNKKLQKNLGVSIDDFKTISGLYKIGGKNGKVKIYKQNTNTLIFEGEYVNGKKMEKEKNII